MVVNDDSRCLLLVSVDPVMQPSTSTSTRASVAARALMDVRSKHHNRENVKRSNTAEDGRSVKKKKGNDIR